MDIEFSLPQYNEIPAVGLFLEQVAKYINEYLAKLGEPELTGSMISNYVKKDIIDNPVKKQYSRDQIAYLIFIAVTKTVISLDDINIIFEMQKQNSDVESAYTYFREEFSSILEAVLKEVDMPVCNLKVNDISGASDESADEAKFRLRLIVRNVLVTVAHKIYLDKTFAMMRNV